MVLDKSNFEYLDNIEKKRAFFSKMYLNSYNKKVLYIHIPYCIRKCKYCICATKIYNNTIDINRYVYESLVNEFTKYKKILESISFDQLYIGGGTPTIISPSCLDDILNMIPNLDKIGVKSIECSPETITSKHLDILKLHGFNYISMGVQSLQENFCKWQNRYFVSKKELYDISNMFRGYDIYFNYDMICYFGKGDIRDIPSFYDDMRYVTSTCKPSSVCVHQLHQIDFSEEKTRHLIHVINKIISESNGEYECVNSELKDEDVLFDTMYQAEYRIVKEKKDFCHYMWKRYPSIPVKYYDVLALSADINVSVNSNVDNIVFVENSDEIGKIEYKDFIYNDYYEIRKKKGLPI